MSSGNSNICLKDNNILYSNRLTARALYKNLLYSELTVEGGQRLLVESEIS